MVPARWALIADVVFFNLLPWTLGWSTGVAYGAHLGSFGVGALIATLLERRPEAVKKARAQEAMVRARSETPDLGTQIQRLVRSEMYEDAARLYFAAQPAEIRTVPATTCLDLSEGILGLGRSSSARRILEDIVKHHRGGIAKREARRLLASQLTR